MREHPSEQVHRGGLGWGLAAGVVFLVLTGLVWFDWQYTKSDAVNTTLPGTYEATAMASLRQIHRAQAEFADRRLSDDGQFASALGELGAHGLLAKSLASGTRGGYVFHLLSDGDNWQAAAAPSRSGVTGEGYFAIDQQGSVYARVEGPFRLDLRRSLAEQATRPTAKPWFGPGSQ